jgi:hypothetical protein
LFLLGIGGCVALIGGTAKTVSEGISEVEASREAEDDKNRRSASVGTALPRPGPPGHPEAFPKLRMRSSIDEVPVSALL